MFVLGDPVDYDFDSSRSLAAQAQEAGVDPREYAYDMQLQRDGRQLIYNPIFNFAHGNLDAVREMITSPVSMFGSIRRRRPLRPDMRRQHDDDLPVHVGPRSARSGWAAYRGRRTSDNPPSS